MKFIIENKTLKEIRGAEPIVYIPEGVVSLEHDVFNMLPNVREVYFPESLIDCSQFRSLLFRNQMAIHVSPLNPAFASHEGVLYNKNFTTLLSCPMEKKGCYKLLRTTLRIEQQAFCCTSLTELLLNDGLVEIGEGAFCDSIYIENIRIPRTVHLIEPNAFYRSYVQDIALMVDCGSYAANYAKEYGLTYTEL